MTDLKHVTPTKEELAEKAKVIEAELAELSQKHEAGEVQDDPGEENVDPNDKKEVAPVVEVKKEKEEVVTDEAEDDGEPSVEERYKNSTQEAQILHSKTKKMQEAFKKVKNVAEPTVEEMTKEYPEWEDMSDLEKRLATKDWKNDRRFEAINEIAEETENAEAWSGKVDTFIDDPETLQKNPKLEGKVEKFKLFANKNTRRGVDFDDLIKAFLFDVEIAKPAKKKGAMFEVGSGGDNKKQEVKSDKLTVEQGAVLKKTNYPAYVQALRDKKIESNF